MYKIFELFNTQSIYTAAIVAVIYTYKLFNHSLIYLYTYLTIYLFIYLLKYKSLLFTS